MTSHKMTKHNKITLSTSRNDKNGRDTKSGRVEQWMTQLSGLARKKEVQMKIMTLMIMIMIHVCFLIL